MKNNENTVLTKALRKAKWQQLLKNTGLTLLILIILAIPTYLASHSWIQKQSQQLMAYFNQVEIIASPNIQSNTRALANNYTFHGQVVSQRSKNIDGYIVPWSPIVGSYSWFHNQPEDINMNTDHFENETKHYSYDTVTKQKNMVFYHPSTKYQHLPNDLKDISQMENKVAEVALSFDKPYTIAEIKKKLPKNMNLVWYWLNGPVTNDDQQTNSITKHGAYDFFGFDSETNISAFLKAAKKYNSAVENRHLTSIIKQNQKMKTSDVKITGIVITGQTKNMGKLSDESWVRTSSIGVTAEIVPYITPTK